MYTKHNCAEIPKGVGFVVRNCGSIFRAFLIYLFPSSALLRFICMQCAKMQFTAISQPIFGGDLPLSWAIATCCNISFWNIYTQVFSVPRYSNMVQYKLALDASS
jgi:hypothetical protein